MDFSHFESCIPCITAEGTTEYLANCKSQRPKQEACANTDQTLWPWKPAAANSPRLACSSV
jgi:hypothetical protein